VTETGGKADAVAARHRVRVTTTKDNLTAAVALSRPEAHESELTLEEILAALDHAGICYGLDHAAIEKALAGKVFATPVKVAQGDPIKKGKDTTFEYTFDVKHEIKPKEDADGRIDYRDMNFIQNVTKGTVLVKKTPPTLGVNGKGVDGKEIVAPRGRELPFKNGENTKISESGNELIAVTDGAVVLSHGTVAVKEVAVINGDVDFGVGNVNCVGSVKVMGDVKPGFTVKAGGNIEIHGTVANSNLEAVGDILIKGGCHGSEEGVIKAGGDVVIKYAEGQHIHAGRDVLVGGELVNCHVIAGQHVWVKGRKGKIVGGETNAGKQIRAAVLGSDAGTATILRVAYDEELMRSHHETATELKRLETDGKRVKESLVGLYKLQMSGKITSGQAEALKKFEEFWKGLPETIETLSARKTKIEEQLKENRDASIIGEGTIFPGVQAHFGVVYREITDEVKTRKLLLDGSTVVLTELRPEDRQDGPGGKNA
jgi:uncharacterized protein (DUF342 family)